MEHPGAEGRLHEVPDPADGLGRDPVLVATTDGVGTKVRVAAAVGRFDTVGRDLVNHCVNDALVQGAEPLFFLDYLGLHKQDPEMTFQCITIEGKIVYSLALKRSQLEKK